MIDTSFLWLVLLAVIVAAVAGFYLWALVSRGCKLHRAMLRLRDRIDGSRSPD